MKKTVICAVALLNILPIFAEKKIFVHENSGKVTEFAASEVDSVTINAYAVNPTLNIVKADDVVASFVVKNVYKMTSVNPKDSVTDICGNTYPVTVIGSQIWMAENLRCHKYDTKSGYKGDTIPAAVMGESPYDWYYNGNHIYPYFIDVTDDKNWNNHSQSIHTEDLTKEQMSKLGYVYNWAAAVGLKTEEDIYSKDFQYQRQGICPNGWHLPVQAEWNLLISTLTESNAEKKMKTQSGWYNSGNGTNASGFSSLPAGVMRPASTIKQGQAGIESIGSVVYYMAQDKKKNGNIRSYGNASGQTYVRDDLNFGYKDALSIRCVKD